MTVATLVVFCRGGCRNGTGAGEPALVEPAVNNGKPSNNKKPPKASSNTSNTPMPPPVQPTPTTAAPGGLPNIGATCYMNSALQCLFAVYPNIINDAITALAATGGDSKVLNSLKAIKDALPTGVTSKMMDDFYATLTEAGWKEPKGSQEDSAAFLRTLLSFVNGKIGNQYAIKNKITTVCNTCGHPSVTSDTDSDIRLNIVKDPMDPSITNLDECFAEHFKEVDMVFPNLYNCSICAVMVTAKRQDQLTSAPNIVPISLIRFDSKAKTKLDTKVKYPLNDIKIKKTYGLKSDTDYSLCALIHHEGVYGGGHYTSYIKDATTGNWKLCDDANAPKDIDNVEADARASEAYVFFYKK